MASGLEKGESTMEKQSDSKQNEQVVFEICFKITNKDYKLSLSTRRAWVVGVSLIALRLISQFWAQVF